MSPACPRNGSHLPRKKMERMMFRLPVLASLMFAVGYSSAQAQCAVEPFYIPYLGSNTTTNMSASSGQPCQIYPSAGGTNVMTGIGISSAPSNGTATASGDVIVYRSQPGFTGQDSFTFTITGSGPGGSGTSAIQVGVSVR